MRQPANGRLLAQARGEQPADLVFRGGRIVNVFTRELISADVAVGGGRIAGIGQYDGREVIDLDGRFLIPGLIDAHTYLESSMLAPVQYAAAVLPRGTTTIICDPHEIANVCGLPSASASMTASLWLRDGWQTR
jgi:adenine deaminase